MQKIIQIIRAFWDDSSQTKCPHFLGSLLVRTCRRILSRCMQYKYVYAIFVSIQLPLISDITTVYSQHTNRSMYEPTPFSEQKLGQSWWPAYNLGMYSKLQIAITTCSRCNTTCSCNWELNPLDPRGNHSATSNNMKLVHWPLMGDIWYSKEGLNWPTVTLLLSKFGLKNSHLYVNIYNSV